MARIQVLELPMLVNGDVVRQPFAIIIDQVELPTVNLGEIPHFETTQLHAEADRFAERIGAQGAIVTSVTLDVA